MTWSNDENLYSSIINVLELTPLDGYYLLWLEQHATLLNSSFVSMKMELIDTFINECIADVRRNRGSCMFGRFSWAESKSNRHHLYMRTSMCLYLFVQWRCAQSVCSGKLASNVPNTNLYFAAVVDAILVIVLFYFRIFDRHMWIVYGRSCLHFIFSFLIRIRARCVTLQHIGRVRWMATVRSSWYLCIIRNAHTSNVTVCSTIVSRRLGCRSTCRRDIVPDPTRAFFITGQYFTTLSSIPLLF